MARACASARLPGDGTDTSTIQLRSIGTRGKAPRRPPLCVQYTQFLRLFNLRLAAREPPNLPRVWRAGLRTTEDELMYSSTAAKCSTTSSRTSHTKNSAIGRLTTTISTPTRPWVSTSPAMSALSKMVEKKLNTKISWAVMASKLVRKSLYGSVLLAKHQCQCVSDNGLLAVKQANINDIV